MSWVAVAVAGAAVVGGVVSSNAARSAANTQANAANNATQTNLGIFNTLNDQQSPFRSAGYSALGAIMGGFGMPTSAGGTDPNGNPLARGGGTTGAATGGVDSGFFTHQFNKDDLNANLAPNYDFMLHQGQGAVTNLANVTGGLSGNTFKALNDYTQNYAQNAYQQAYTNYTANQTNIFNRLASIAGLGQTAGSNQATGASTFAGNIGDAQMSAGNAIAAGQVGSANAVSSSLGNISNYYMLQNLINGGGTGSDRRIKQDIERVGTLSNGVGVYRFRYKPEYRARWGDGTQFGFMADEVERVVPGAVRFHRAGYKMVDYMKVIEHAH
jgi:hypothetical protein